MHARDIGLVLKDATEEWQRDKASRLGAAIAYYAAFSVGPLLLLAVSVAGMIFGEQSAEGQILDQLRELMGTNGAAAIQAMLAGAKNPQTGTLATIAGSAMLLVGAAGAFGAIQDALNTVWEVQPRADRGFWGIVQERLLSFTVGKFSIGLYLGHSPAEACSVALERVPCVRNQTPDWATVSNNFSTSSKRVGFRRW